MRSRLPVLRGYNAWVNSVCGGISMLVYTGGLIFIVSFVFAMLGLGGGMLYVPIFHWLGFGLKDVVIPLWLLQGKCSCPCCRT